MPDPTASISNVRRLTIEVRGVVQGVGFRPFVYNLARKQGLTGWVQNEAGAVRIEVQGPPDRLGVFLDFLRDHHPPQATIDSLDIAEIPYCDGAAAAFEIRSSDQGAAPGPTIPADLATCAECLEEIRTAGQRRCGYPFTNCTNCGPRWSIIQSLPYDRPRTSMAGFRLCAECEAEYGDPADRRFHAQPIACPQCGPRLELLDPRGQSIALGQEALEMAAGSVLSGRLLALKGLGGFQLIADATNPDAVARLRERKHRYDKPLAIMLPDLDEARRLCEVSAEEANWLSSRQAPILLLKRRPPAQSPLTPDSSSTRGEGRLLNGLSLSCPQPSSLTAHPSARCPLPIAPAVAPDNPYLGVMLPYTPLHHLLMAAMRRPIVCTSGNLSEEPMATTTEDALNRLGPIADMFLVHDRPIVRPVDDSVARVFAGTLQVIRRARGFAPLPVELGFAGSAILAIGAHLKNTVALRLGEHVIVSPHVGDLDNLMAVGVHERVVRDLVDFYQVVPEAVVCDLHPDYASTRHAERLADAWKVPLIRVQHHHAHVAACMAEHRLQGPVLGFSWDGTGYGTDGTIWGGEVLRCEGSRFDRVAHLRTFSLPGGDKAVREPRRSALGVLFEILGPDAARYAGAWFSASEMRNLLAVLEKGSGLSPRTSSMGRLFDAVACLCGLGQRISFEGQAAMALEFAADGEETAAYPLSMTQAQDVDWEPVVRQILADRAASVPISRISARFHNALAEMTVAIARSCGLEDVVLTGGCFQNALLWERARTRLLAAGFRVYTHQQFPPGDGGIALGQVFVAARQVAGTRRVPPVEESQHVSGNSR